MQCSYAREGHAELFEAHVPHSIDSANLLLRMSVRMQVTLIAFTVYAIVRKLLRRPVPSLQIRVASGPALLTGLLWSAGNFLSIYAVQYLGLALGWPLVQCQLIVSSLWAIFYYREIQGWITIVIFAVSTAVILVGVFILAAHGV